jgi:hypothetical protein
MENSTTKPAVPTAPQNPLTKYFRQPSIYLKLPSNGRFWGDGGLDLPVTGEIPIYPMTARDEVSLRTPDSLMNGQGVVDVVQSCCPNIKNAWKMPSVDVDAILIGIRIASYGHEMDIDTKCPHCGEENNHSLDLRSILGGVVCPDYVQKIEVNNLKIKVKPQEFFTVNKQNSVSFEEQRMLEALEKADLTVEERSMRIADSMNKLLKISVDTVTNCTELIELDDGSVVTNSVYINEFYNNVDAAVVRAVQKRLSEINSEAEIKARKVICTNEPCSKEYEIPLEFDYSNFFVKGS